MLEEVFASAGIDKNALDACLIGIGPGAFTGIRIGVSWVQGIALGLSIPCYAISTLQILAHQAFSKIQTDLATNQVVKVLSTVDARMNEVYCGVFSCESSNIKRLSEEKVLGIDGFQSPQSVDWVCGTGAALLQDSTQNLDIIEECYPQAESLFALYDQGHYTKSSAQALSPSYIRNQVTHQN